MRVWSAHAVDVEMLSVWTRGRWQCTFANLVSCQAMMCGRITARQSIRELHLWLKMRMIRVVTIGWTRCYKAGAWNKPWGSSYTRGANFFDMLKASEELLHEHTTVSILTFITRITSIKSKFTFSNKCYKKLLRLFSDVLPSNHKMPKDMYQSTKLLSALGMEYEKIDVSKDNCMIFYKEHKNEKKCLNVVNRGLLRS
jgi:hypothetical protein